MISSVSKEEYSNLVQRPFSVFDTVPFCELNRHKVDDLQYLIVNDGKNRFGMIAGIKDGVMKFPFSATFSGLSPIAKDSKIICYYTAITELSEYAKSIGCIKIVFGLPPFFMMPTHLTYLYNALLGTGFDIESLDVNFEYNLEQFNADTYDMSIDPKARQKLRASLKNNLTFSKTDDIAAVYEIISQNHSSRGFPLHLSLDAIYETIRIIPADFFIVHDNTKNPIAGAMIYKVTDNTGIVVYWGNTPSSEELRPMNFLSFNVFNFYKNEGLKMLSIGTSTVDGIPNHGLCDFKQGIGCSASPKFNFVKELV